MAGTLMNVWFSCPSTCYHRLELRVHGATYLHWPYMVPRVKVAIALMHDASA